MNSSISSTSSLLILSTESTTTKGQFQVDDTHNVRTHRARSSKSVQNAVYAYVRAIRALGRTKVNTSEVANALSLPVNQVNGVLESLRKKGVRALNG